MFHCPIFEYIIHIVMYYDLNNNQMCIKNIIVLYLNWQISPTGLGNIYYVTYQRLYILNVYLSV